MSGERYPGYTDDPFASNIPTTTSVERLDSGADRLLSSISESMRATVGVLTRSPLYYGDPIDTSSAEQEAYIPRGSVDMEPLKQHVSDIFGGLVLHMRIDELGSGLNLRMFLKYIPMPEKHEDDPFRAFFRERFENETVDQRRDLSDAYSVCRVALQRMSAARRISLIAVNSTYDTLAFARRVSYWGQQPGPENMIDFLIQLNSLAETVSNGGVEIDKTVFTKAFKASHFLAVEADILGAVA